MLRTSSYTIYVDLPDNDREMLLVHGYTGAYDKVSKGVAKYLRSREARRAPKPLYGEWSSPPAAEPSAEAPSDQVLDSLRQRGYLTRMSVETEREFFGRLAVRLHERASRGTPSFIFMPTYDCNLRCSYCFQDHMRTDCGFRHLLRTMRPQMIDRIFEGMSKIEERHGVDPAAGGRRDIGFFGGEPLLAANRGIVEKILSKAGERADFWAVTNGTELEAYADLLVPGKLDRLQITLDGPPQEHDQRRVDADGGGTFERIARNITMALDIGTQISVRLNVDRGNIGELPAVADEIHARGWHRYQNFSAYTATINPSNDQTDRKTTMNTWQLEKALTEMREEHPNLRVLGRPDESIRARARQIFGGAGEILPQLKPSFCSAHSNMYIFDPFGDIYACWERTGDARIRVGRVLPDGDVELASDQHKKWRSRTVASNPVCQQCRYALHCGGGCAILALGQRGKFHSNYCDGFASRFRASVADAYLAHAAGAPAENHQQRVCDL